MITRFTSSSYCLASQVKLSSAKKIHPEAGGWFLGAYSVMTNFRAKAMNSVAKWTNSIAKVTNSFANGTNSIAKPCSNYIISAEGRSDNVIPTYIRKVLFSVINFTIQTVRSPHIFLYLLTLWSITLVLECLMNKIFKQEIGIAEKSQETRKDRCGGNVNHKSLLWLH